MKGRVKLRLYLPGLAPKTYRMYKKSGYYYVKVGFNAAASTGPFTVRAFGHDVNGQRQSDGFHVQAPVSRAQRRPGATRDCQARSA